MVYSSAQFVVTPEGHIRVTYAEALGSSGPVRKERVFCCPPEGGFVRELQDSYFQGKPLWGQVCERLAPVGLALVSSSRDALLDCVQRAVTEFLQDQGGRGLGRKSGNS